MPFKNLSNPESFGLSNTFHFKFEHDDVSIGLWFVNFIIIFFDRYQHFLFLINRHSIPQGEELKLSNGIDEHFNLNLGNKENEILVIYLHGNTNDRYVWAI